MSILPKSYLLSYSNKPFIRKINCGNSTNIYKLSHFNKINIPKIINSINNNYFTSLKKNKNIFIQDMLIKKDNDLIIPNELNDYNDIIITIIKNYQHKQYKYIYLNIDERHVLPNTNQRRYGWHSDSYRPDYSHEKKIIADTIFIAYNSLPTMFTTTTFNIDKIYNNDELVLEYFNNKVKDNSIILPPCNNILQITPYCIHNAGYNNTNQIVYRKFLKVVFSNEKYNLKGNTINPFFCYNDWSWRDRNMLIRNSPFEYTKNK